jgi:hypothetical protein
MVTALLPSACGESVLPHRGEGKLIEELINQNRPALSLPSLHARKTSLLLPPIRTQYQTRARREIARMT